MEEWEWEWEGEGMEERRSIWLVNNV